MPKDNPQPKPQRLYFKSYLQVIRDSVGSEMFRNFYVKTPEKGEFDAFGDGENSCAFFVSAVLALFKKINDIHGTVENTVKALKEAGWQEVSSPQPGDVIVWEPMTFPEGPVKHIGFAIGDGKAVSTSWKQKCVIEHDINFGETKRKVKQIFRMKEWAG